MSQNMLNKNWKTSQCLYKLELKKEAQSLDLFVVLKWS